MDQAAQARRWLKELDLAGKREKTWREKAEKVIERYRGEERKKNRFNVLWSNTETLRPAIYNSRPNPDVRRRFRDADPLGKAVSEVLERALMVMVDYECTDQCLKNDTLDGLLVGRGVSRIRYIPSLVGGDAKAPREETDTSGAEDEPDGQLSGVEEEKVDYEQVIPEHVDWRDYRESYGRVWDEVPSIFFRHKLTRPDATDKFGAEAIRQVEFTVPLQDDPQNAKTANEQNSETQKVSEFWEVWDKLGTRVFFIHEKVEQLLYPKDNPTGAPPIKFASFFPVPEPLKIIENTGSLLPIIPFALYETQADQLDKISARIDKIVDNAKLRGIYDAKLTELGDVMASDDNDLTPIQNAQAWSEKGLDGAISWFPVEKAGALLEGLYEARERQKAIIDELTGISDIIRGATDPDETATAQNLKQTNASVRLQRMQKEVQRYAKDIMRLAAEAICEKFAPQTLEEMTELKFPTPEQKQMAQMQQQPPQPGQPPPPADPILQLPTWEDIMGLMKSPGMRRFKVDVETDSTVAATLNSDMAGMSLVLKSISELLQGFGPVILSGALPVDAAKELVMAVIRRARMGMAVEDAFDKMKAPNPPPPPPDHAVQVAQINAQSHEKIEGAKIQSAGQTAQIEQAAQTQQRQAELQMEMQKAQQEAQIELQKDAQEKQHELALKQSEQQLEMQKLAAQLENDRLIADANNQTKVIVAEIAAKVALVKQATDVAADAQAQDKDIDAQGDTQDKQIKADQKAAEAPTAAAYEQPESEFVPVMKELIEHLKKPRRVIREGGRIVGLQ